MKCKIFVIVVMISILFSNVIFVKAASRDTNSKELLRKAKIDSLYKKRNELCIDFNKNRKEIDMIDNDLKKLGVEKISYYEFKTIMGQSHDGLEVQPFIDVPSESGVSWTSTRYVYVHLGKQYEIQEIRAVQGDYNGPLYRTDIVYKRNVSNVEKSANVAKIIATSTVGFLPKIGGVLGAGVTIGQAIADLFGMEAAGIIKNVEVSCTVAITAEYVYDFVKPYGVPDAGRQVLGYVGNGCDLYTAVNISHCVFNGKKFKPLITAKTYEGSTKSAFYESGRWEVACENYRKYKENGMDFDAHAYEMYYCDLQALDGSAISIKIPSATKGYY